SVTEPNTAPSYCRRKVDAGYRGLTMARTTSRPTPIPRLQPISFFSTGSNGSTFALRRFSPIFTSFTWAVCDIVRVSKSSAGQRRLDADEEQPGNQKPDPDHEAEQA